MGKKRKKVKKINVSPLKDVIFYIFDFLYHYSSKKLTHKHEAPTKVSSEKVKAALQIQNAPKPSLSGIGNTSQTKVLTATLEKPETPSPTKKSPVIPINC